MSIFKYVYTHLILILHNAEISHLREQKINILGGTVRLYVQYIKVFMDRWFLTALYGSLIFKLQSVRFT